MTVDQQTTIPPKRSTGLRVVDLPATIRQRTPVLFWTVCLLLAVEIGTGLLGPLAIPPHTYLSLAMSEKQKSNTTAFYADANEMLMYDEACGWLNRPGFAHDKWVVDAHGSRSTAPITIERNHKRRVIFLGNSLTNGSTHVRVEDTISAAIEDSTTEALNFATMLYGIDQCYLLYREHLHGFHPDVVVVGLSSRPTDKLVNRYVPFRSYEQVNMPFLRPRFMLTDDGMQLLSTPSPAACQSIYRSPELIDTLRDTDAYYADFRGRTRWMFTPLASTIWETTQTGKRFLSRFDRELPYLELYRAIVTALVSEIASDGARIVFMLLPPRKVVARSWRDLLPDQYAHLRDAMRSWGLTVMDGRQVIRDAGIPLRSVYHADGGHFSPRGNRLLAGALKPLIDPRAQ